MSAATRFLRPHLLRTPFKVTTRITFSNTRPLNRLTQIQAQLFTSNASMAGDTQSYRANGDNGDDANTEGELNEWKHRAPYKVHDNDPDFKARYEGSCHCGKVKYQLSREKPLDAKFCHCTTCQKLHSVFYPCSPIPNPTFTVADAKEFRTTGAPFQWAAIFHKEDINFTHGHHDLGWYESSEKTCAHKLPCKVSCAYCRCPIMDEGRNMILLFPTLIDFKDPADRKNFDISCHMFYPRRVLDINDGKPKWSGINNGPESELIEDSPQEAINELKRKRQEEAEKESKEQKNE